MTHTLFPSKPPSKAKKTPNPLPKSIPQQHPQSSRFEPSPSPSPPSLPVTTSPSIPSSVSLEKQPMHQYSTHQISHPSPLSSSTKDSSSESDSTSSIIELDTSDSNLADISKLLIAEPTETTEHTTEVIDSDDEPQITHETGESSHSVPPRPKVPKPSNGPWFTFDDIPIIKWRERLQELSAWIDVQMLASGATTQSVLREFSTRFTGSLRDWFDSLGQYR